MNDYFEKGERYRVLKDSFDFFKAGDIVVAIEDGGCVNCVVEDKYKINKSSVAYYVLNGLCSLLDNSEVEEV